MITSLCYIVAPAVSLNKNYFSLVETEDIENNGLMLFSDSAQ